MVIAAERQRDAALYSNSIVLIEQNGNLNLNLTTVIPKFHLCGATICCQCQHIGHCRHKDNAQTDLGQKNDGDPLMGWFGWHVHRCSLMRTPASVSGALCSVLILHRVNEGGAFILVLNAMNAEQLGFFLHILKKC